MGLFMVFVHQQYVIGICDGNFFWSVVMNLIKRIEWHIFDLFYVELISKSSVTACPPLCVYQRTEPQAVQLLINATHKTRSGSP